MNIYIHIHICQYISHMLHSWGICIIPTIIHGGGDWSRLVYIISSHNHKHSLQSDTHPNQGVKPSQAIGLDWCT